MRVIRHIFKTISIILGLLILGVIILYMATAGEQAVPATVATDPTLPHVTIDDMTFHAQTYGKPGRPVVVVVHGGPGGDYGYLLNLHALEDEYFVVFYDQRGAGLSPRVDSTELTLATMVADLHRIITHYGQGDAVKLIGHSWGAMLAAAYIGEHPTTVDKVVLAEPGGLDNSALARFREHQTDSQGLAYYQTLLITIFESLHLEATDQDAQMDYIFKRMSDEFVNAAATGYRCSDVTVEAVVPDVPLPPSRFGARAFNTLFGPNADLSSIKANGDRYTNEILFLASSCNEFLGEAFQRTQMEIFPNARLAIIPDAGHEMVSENPAATLATIRDYFGRH